MHLRIKEAGKEEGGGVRPDRMKMSKGPFLGAKRGKENGQEKGGYQKIQAQGILIQRKARRQGVVKHYPRKREEQRRGQATIQKIPLGKGNRSEKNHKNNTTQIGNR